MKYKIDVMEQTMSGYVRVEVERMLMASGATKADLVRAIEKAAAEAIKLVNAASVG